MKTTIYHNPQCSKSREALQFLQNENADIEVIEYLKTPPNHEELKAIVDKLGITPDLLLRKKEPVFISQFKDSCLTDDEWIDVMVQFPQLIERPIVIQGKKAIIGRPVERILDLI
jgi:arsenate reductase